MDKIVRYIKRPRDNGFIQTFQFTTYDLIFNPKFRAQYPEAGRLLLHLQHAFMAGVPARDASPSQSKELMIETKQHLGHPFSEMAFKSGAKGKGNPSISSCRTIFSRTIPTA